MPLIQSAAASFHLKKESTGYFEIISLHFLSFSTIFDEGHTCLQPLHINHKQGGRRLTNFSKLITPLWGSIFFVPPNNFQVWDPWRVFWADLVPHCKAVWIFPQKYAPSVGINKPIRGAFKRHEKVKANAQAHKALPTKLILSKDLLGTNLTRKVVSWPKFSSAWPEWHYLK